MGNGRFWRSVRRFILWIEILTILVLGIGMGVVFAAIYQMNRLLPPDSALDAYRPPIGTKIYSADKVLLATIAAENREPAPLDRIPKRIQDAVVAIEDERFFRHSGVDYAGALRALWVNLREGDLSQGASTITQQLARSIFLHRRKEFSRKFKEVLIAAQIERNWTKQQILEAYLNQVYFGSGAYGIQSAARIYFNKSMDELTLAEIALLAGLPQRPGEYSPHVYYRREHHFDRVKARRNAVLRALADQGYVPRRECEAAMEEPIRVVERKNPAVGYFKAKYFVQYVLDQLRDVHKYDPDLIDKGGLTIITTLNWKMQQAAEKAAREGRDRFRRYNASEVALVCLDPHSGYIRAMVGGVNEPWEKYQFNCATQAKRQPGSSFKLFVYAAAFEEGKTPRSSVAAAARPIRMSDGKVYAPKNHGRFYGTTSYQTAFAQSINGAAVNVCVEIGPKTVADLAHRMGIASRLYAYPSLALGSSEVTVLEMASAFGVFPARGMRAQPMAIIKVLGPGGEVRDEFTPQLRPVGLKPSTIDYVNRLTRAVVAGGTGTAARVVPNAHGKTGTSQDYTDAWFVGYTPELVTAVWAGNRNNTEMSRAYGGTICAPIWAAFMKQALPLNPSRRAASSGESGEFVTVATCAESGLLARRGCKEREQIDYRRGSEPTEWCPIHRSRRQSRRGEPPPDANQETPAPDAAAPSPDPTAPIPVPDLTPPPNAETMQ